MGEKNYKRKYEFQKKMALRQSKQIEDLKFQIERLKLECEEKDKIINSVNSLKDELSKDVSEVRKYKEEYVELVDELRKMKNTINQTVYKGRWNLIKFIIR